MTQIIHIVEAGGFGNAGKSAAGTITAEAVSSDYFANAMLRSEVREPRPAQLPVTRRL